MYDDIVIKMDLNPSPYPLDGEFTPFYYKGIEFIPIHNNLGKVTKFRGNVSNMALEIEPQILIIRNSIHKYLIGNNYSDFTLSDVSSTAGKFIYEFDLDIRDAMVKKLSYAVNISMENPDAVYSGFESYLTRPFSDMRRRNLVYGKSYIGVDFKIKCYNKTMETKLHYRENLQENILRFEVEINNLRYIHNRKDPIAVYTFKDLYNFETANKLLEDLLSKYRKVYKKPNIDSMDPSIKELRILALFSDPDCLKVEKERFPHSYKNDKKKISKIMEDKSGLELYDEVEEKIISKGKELLSG